MQVGSINQVNFKSMASLPVVNAPQVRVERMSEAEGKSSILNILNDKFSWVETYNPKDNSVCINSCVATDRGTYNISNDGTATHGGGFTVGGPVTTILVEKNPDLAEYVQVKKKEFEIKNKLQNEVGVSPKLNQYIYSPAMVPVCFGNNVKDNIDAKSSKVEDLKIDMADTKIEKNKTTAKEKVANVWKFFTTADKMVGAVLKGTIYGALTGAVLSGGAWLFRALPKAFTKEGPKFVEVFKHPLKHIGKAGKVIAGLGTAAVFAYHVVAGKLEANQRTAVIDHKLKTGHRDV